MKIRVTIGVCESKANDFEESKKLLPLAVKGILEKYLGRLISLEINIPYAHDGGSSSTYIELEDEEPKKET